MKSLEELEKFAKENYVPIIRGESGHFLQQVIASERPKRVLEIGTAIGYSGSLILNAFDGCHLVTIEKNEEYFKIASQTFQDFGSSNRVKQILGDAGEVLKGLAARGEKFDFVFLDGPKGQYVSYLPLCKKLLEKGGILFVDNINHDGLVFSQVPVVHKHRTMIVNLRKFVKDLQSDSDFDTNIVQIEDGICLSRLK